MSTMIAKMMIAWLKKKHKYLLREAVIPEGYHVHKNPEKVKA